MATNRKPARGTLAWEIQQRRIKDNQRIAREQEARGEVYHVGNAKVTKPPKPPKTEEFTLIRAAHRLIQEQASRTASINEHFARIAEDKKMTVQVVSESVLSLLANIAVKAEQQQPIDLMHINSVAAFLAGVESIALALPSSTDEQKKQNTLRALAVAGLGEDGTINDATFPIINLGARKAALHAQWGEKLKAYTATGDGAQLAQAVRQLQMNVDRAMRSTMAQKSAPATGASMQGHPPSGS